MTIAKSLSSPVTFVFDRLNDDEIEAKERELDDRLKQDDEQALRNANQLCEEQDNVSTKQQAKTKSKKKSSTNNKQMKNDVMFTPELLSSSMNFISSPSHITTSRDNQENISTWCISEEIKEYNLDNVEFEHDELIDDPCYNNEKMPEVNQFKEDIQYEDPVVHCQNSQDQFEQILRQFHKINHKLDDIYEYLSSDRIINIIQRKFFIELPEPLSSRTYSASTSNEMHNLFAIFGLQFEHDYKRLWSETFPKLIRPCFRPGSIQIDLFGFAHLRTNPSIPSITSPNIDPIDSYNSYRVLKKKTKEFCANQILIGEVTTSCLDFKDCNQESIEQELHERELKLLMSANNQEYLHQQTPKVQKRSGHSGLSLLHAELNGSTTLSSTTASNLISRPTYFRHLVSICREQNLHHQPAIDHNSSSSTNPNTILPTSPTYISGSTNNIHSSNSTMMQIHSDSSNNQNFSHNLYTNQSTLATPNLNRLQTLT
ncbi:unnamed protein product [Rotaria sp. Silwood2]|nr:unnamed protein product [Rotaria sp. Silwood2]